MATVVDELVTLLGMDLSPGTIPNVNKFSAMIGNVMTKVGFLSAGIVAATTGMIVFAEKSNSSAAELDKFNRLTGLSTDNLQELQFAAEQVGGSADALKSDLIGLTKSMSSPIPGEFNNALFMLGIQLNKATGEIKSADEVLLDIADKFEGMTRQKKIQWGSKIGLSADTILLLDKGRAGIEALKKQARDLPIIISPQQAKDAQELIASLSVLKRIVNFIGQSISTSLAPALTDVVNRMTDWISDNREFIGLGMETIIAGVIKGFSDFGQIIIFIKNVFSDLFPWVEKVFSGFGNIDIIANTVIGSLSVLAGAIVILFAKFALIAGVIMAAGLVFDDFITFLKGGDSVIGDIIESVEKLFNQFNERFPAIGTLLRSLGSIFKEFGSIISTAFIKTLELGWEQMKTLGSGISWLIDGIIGKFNDLLEFVGLDKFAKKAATSLKNAKIDESIGQVFKGSIRDVQGFNKANFPQSISNSNQTNQSSQSQTKNENSISATFNITGDKSPKQTAEAVTSSLQELMTRTFPGSLAPAVQ